MTKTLLRAVTCAMVLLTAGAAFAQERATLLLKSGERVTGELFDMNRIRFFIRVNGEERRYAIEDVAVVDFTGNATNLPAVKLEPEQGGNVMVLRNGQHIPGRMEDIGGRHPLRITFVPRAGRTDFRSSEISRIYLATPPATAATSGRSPEPPAVTGPSETIHVSASQPWTPTGMFVQQGQTISFSSSGEVRLSTDGKLTSTVNGRPGLEPSRATLPSTLVGALIGRIGNGAPFGIGGQASIVAPATGQLFLGVNDDHFNDNSGEFVVILSGGTFGNVRGRRVDRSR